MPSPTFFRPLTALLLMLLSMPGCSTVESTLDARVPELLARHRVASVGIALIEKGTVTLERAYGEQSEGVPATSATLFNLASLTKPVAAEVLLRLVSANELSLDEPLSTHWVDPDVASDPRHQQLTLRIALSHQSGLPNWRGHGPGGKLAFTFTPGTAFGYSGEGYGYAARFAERKLGVGFEELADQQLFGRLGMVDTAFSWREWMQGRLAIPLIAPGQWGAPQVESQWNAANNLITTAGDYARFVASVMRGDALDPPLRDERWRPVRGPQQDRPCELQALDACPRASSTVFGWIRLDFEDGPVFMHTGSNGRPGGERTLAYFDPARRRGVVIFTSGAEGEPLYREIVALVDPGSRVARYLGAR